MIDDDSSIFEVERKDYITFIGQLNLDLMDRECYLKEDREIVKLISKKTNKKLCSRVSDNANQTEKYFIFNYPEDDERRAPKPVCRVTLNTREEVQAFFDALNKMQKEAKENAGTIQ